jgi:Neprosin
MLAHGAHSDRTCLRFSVYSCGQTWVLTFGSYMMILAREGRLPSLAAPGGDLVAGLKDLRLIAAILLTVLAGMALTPGISLAASSAASTPPNCGGPASNPHHCFVAAEENWGSPIVTGLGASFTEPSQLPGVKSNGNSYSITQLWLASQTQFYYKIIEYGWIVDPAVYHNHFPHLFIDLRFAGVNGNIVKPCFIGIPGNNPCPLSVYTPLSTKYYAGMAVGGALHQSTGFYYIGYYQGWWWIQYKNQWLGKVNTSFWSLPTPIVNVPTGFAAANYGAWWGEVASDNNPCTPMGNGTYGSHAGAAKITNMVYGTSAGAFPAKANISQVTDGQYWTTNIKSVDQTFSSFGYGGPHGGPECR